MYGQVSLPSLWRGSGGVPDLPLTGGCRAQVSQEDLEIKQTAVTESALLFLRLIHFLLQMLQMAADLCLIFGFSLELIWAVFVAGFVTFVEEQQITLFLDNLIVSLKVIFTVFSAEVEPRAWYMEELHIPASLLLYI